MQKFRGTKNANSASDLVLAKGQLKNHWQNKKDLGLFHKQLVLGSSCNKIPKQRNYKAALQTIEVWGIIKNHSRGLAKSTHETSLTQAFLVCNQYRNILQCVCTQKCCRSSKTIRKTRKQRLPGSHLRF